MPRNQAPPEESDPSRRGSVAGREHHEPDPDVRVGRADPKRSDSGEEDSIGRRHPSYRDEDDDEDDHLDQVSAGSRRSPDREAEAYELDEADVVDEIDLDDLEDDDERTRPDEPDEPDA